MRNKYFLFTTLIFLSFIKFAQGQTNVYVPFPDSAAQWNEDQSWCNGCADKGLRSYYDNGYFYKLTHDTIINNLTYHLINFAWKWSKTSDYNPGLTSENDYNLPVDTIGSLIGAFREDSLHRIYYRNFDDLIRQFCLFDPYPKDSDVLIYDFSLNLGDTTIIPIHVYNDTLVITGTDSILVGKYYRRILILNPISSNGLNIVWCEGIGCLSYGLLWPFQPTESELVCITQLDCYSQNNRVVYDSAAIGCDSITTYNYTAGINTLLSPKLSLQVFPNPANDELFLKFSQNFIPKEITVYNSIGQQIYLPFNAATNKSLAIENLPAGLYIIKATNDDVFLTDSFIKE